MMKRLSIRLLGCLWLVCCMAAPAFAEATAEATTAPPSSEAKPAAAPEGASGKQSGPTLQDKPQRQTGIGGARALTVVFGLALILLLIYGCAWLMKRAGAINLGGVAGMKIVAGVSVGPREKVLLLEVGDQQVLVGVAPGRVSHLASFEQPVIESPEMAGPGEFSRRLKRFMAAGAGERGESRR